MSEKDEQGNEQPTGKPSQGPARVQAWAKANPDRVRLADRRRYHALTPAQKKERYWYSWLYNYLPRKYHVSPERLHDLLARQDMACAICRDPFTSPPTVDHDHTCCAGKESCGRCVRGLLCRGCNSMLGAAQDDPIRLIQATKYLEVTNVPLAIA